MPTFGQDLVASATEAVAIARGDKEPAKTITVETVDVAAIRKKLGLSQEAFARKFGLSPATLRDWEQGRRSPDRTARALLKVIDHAPDTVERAQKGA
ncbi:NadS family protein [Bosea sp. RAC05]|jgi:putative transcriptional regulator|uniref:NadS family protein n=1 Tax=Bosea sp. RAC05 TaxID=1842539 RepID=UPI00083D9F0C|nr:NadS family protein [Bosea sp. RAC05]AOG03553.1 helix-turn-helix family protein [Bosea sp. RAC05]